MGGVGRGGAGGGRPAALSVGQLVSLCTAISFLPCRLLLLFGGWIVLSCAQIFKHIFCLILSMAHIMYLTFSSLFRITYAIGGEGVFHLINL